MFTNKARGPIEKAIKEVSTPQFASPGDVARADVELIPGVEVFKNYSTSNEEYIKTLGLDIEITDSKIHLIRPYIAAQKNKPLTVEQSRILKFLGIKLSEFKVIPLAFYNKKSGQVVDIE